MVKKYPYLIEFFFFRKGRKIKEFDHFDKGISKEWWQ